jgi:hypothetical protein
MKKNILLLSFLVIPLSCTNSTLTNPNPESSPTSVQTINPSATPVSQKTPLPGISSTPVPFTLTGLSGHVYDAEGILLDGAKVTAQTVDTGINWKSKEVTTVRGLYEIKDAPGGVNLQINATKPGYGPRQRTEVLKTGITGVNVYDFGGPDNEFFDPDHNVEFKVSGLYSLPEEPEVISIKVNGKQASGPGEVFPTILAEGTREGQTNIINYLPNQFTPVGLFDIDGSNLRIEMQFSKAVDTASVQNMFRLQSEATNDKNDLSHIREKANDPTGKEPAFSIDIFPDDKNNDNEVDEDDTSKYLFFTWNNEKTSVLIEYRHELTALKSPPQTRYKISFAGPFRDLSGKLSRSATARIFENDLRRNKVIGSYGEYITSVNGYIRYGFESADYLTFSVTGFNI